ncbi:MAG: hypothetical protein AAF468_06595 [Pseudomonadota bacterium]
MDTLPMARPSANAPDGEGGGIVGHHGISSFQSVQISGGLAWHAPLFDPEIPTGKAQEQTTTPDPGRRRARPERVCFLQSTENTPAIPVI